MAKCIMIQGTASNAGKSWLTAALCRIFRQDGYRVAPFKSQNMALNSFLTEEGLEMGRAQAVQAEAAGIVPRACMNPILLKPTGDSGSQVIVNGEAIGQMSAGDYFRYRHKLRPAILAAYHRLAREYDIVVIEGAGSPAEINLKDNDIVNMGMAQMARSPVLLAADIDRGGVFASVYGTVALLDDEERRLVKGVVINKFRGDVDILRPGLVRLEELTGVPVLGVVPYMRVDIDDEDSLAERLKGGRASEQNCGAAVGLADIADIAVIRLPRMANFSDFSVFDRMPEAALRYIARQEEWGRPDMVILPGTQNTIADLAWLRQRGLAALIQKHAVEGGAVWGLGGGYQMLGRTLAQADVLEQEGDVPGLGLMNVATVFRTGDVRKRVTGRFCKVHGVLSDLDGAGFAGYEIHRGETWVVNSAGGLGRNVFPLCGIEDAERGRQRNEGCQMGSVYGTYVHGIFDLPDVAKAVVTSLLREKGIADASQVPEAYEVYRQKQYDKLAEGVRASVDMARVYEIMELGMG